jgi:hypothetical protein
VGGQALLLRNLGDPKAVLRVLGSVLGLVGYHAAEPFFIVGTGRCGSSLLVEILRSHHELAVFPDEANELWHPNSYPFEKRRRGGPSIIENPREFTEISRSSWPAGQEKRIRDVLSAYNFVHGPHKRLVHKSAMITFLLPQILRLFPDARFCHIYRSGPPVVESLVKKDWQKYSDRFGDQASFRAACARYWNDCILEIERQNKALQLGARGSLLELSYEGLCADPRGAYSRLASFLDIRVDAYTFNPDNIRSQDYKVGDYSSDPIWRRPLQLMTEGMQLKGFPISA